MFWERETEHLLLPRARFVCCLPDDYDRKFPTPFTEDIHRTTTSWPPLTEAPSLDTSCNNPTCGPRNTSAPYSGLGQQLDCLGHSAGTMEELTPYGAPALPGAPLRAVSPALLHAVSLALFRELAPVAGGSGTG